MEVVRHAVDDGRRGKQGNGNKKCFSAANKVGYEPAHKTAACHGCEIPEGDRAYIAHGQPPVLHQGRGNEPEVPVVHLFAKIRHHNNEKNGFVASCDLKSVEVVIADSLLAWHGFFLLALGVERDFLLLCRNCRLQREQEVVLLITGRAFLVVDCATFLEVFLDIIVVQAVIYILARSLDIFNVKKRFI